MFVKKGRIVHAPEIWKTSNFQLFTNKRNPWKGSDDMFPEEFFGTYYKC